jgi:hypothetical protein
MRTARCLCGACKYESDGDPVVVVHCHCMDERLPTYQAQPDWKPTDGV